MLRSIDLQHADDPCEDLDSGCSSARALGECTYEGWAREHGSTNAAEMHVAKYACRKTCGTCVAPKRE